MAWGSCCIARKEEELHEMFEWLFKFCCHVIDIRLFGFGYTHENIDKNSWILGGEIRGRLNLMGLITA